MWIIGCQPSRTVKRGRFSTNDEQPLNGCSRGPFVTRCTEYIVQEWSAKSTEMRSVPILKTKAVRYFTVKLYDQIYRTDFGLRILCVWPLRKPGARQRCKERRTTRIRSQCTYCVGAFPRIYDAAQIDVRTTSLGPPQGKPVPARYTDTNAPVFCVRWSRKNSETGRGGLERARGNW